MNNEPLRYLDNLNRYKHKLLMGSAGSDVKILTNTAEWIIMTKAGETEAGSAEAQPVRDNRHKATNCRWGSSYTPVAPPSDNLELCYTSKKPNKTAPPKADSVRI